MNEWMTQLTKYNVISDHFVINKSRARPSLSGRPLPGHSSPDVTPECHTWDWGQSYNSLASFLQCNGTGPAPTQSIDFIQDHVAFALKVAFLDLTWHFPFVIFFWWSNDWLRTRFPRPSRTFSPRRPWSRCGSPSPSPSFRCPTGRHTPSPWPWTRPPGTVYKMDSTSSCQQR